MTLDGWLEENYPDARVIPYSLVVYKCPACGSRYTVCPEEASVPYCTNEDCPDREEETCPECVIAELKAVCESRGEPEGFGAEETLFSSGG